MVMMRIQACLFVLFFSSTWIGSAEVLEGNGPLQQVNVILQREYLDGERSEEKVTERFWRIEEVYEKYKGWDVVEQTKEHLILHTIENDLSPLLKENGYLGITANGALSIYHGKPEYEQIIHTFFQIDVGKLEVYQQEALQQGIPISSKEQFTALINEYKVYSIK